VLGIAPIPKELLIHTIEYCEYIPGSPFGEAYEEPVTINFVRFEPSSKLIKGQSGNNESIQGVGVFFMDYTHSLPFIVPSDKSKFVFDEKEYFVKQVDKLYADSSIIHHLEVLV
jgi:hypothetical protein